MQHVMEAPLIKSVDLLTRTGCHTPRVSNIEENRKYVHVVKSDLGLQTNGGMPYVTIESLHARVCHLNPPAEI